VHLAEEPKPKGIYATLARNWHWAALSGSAGFSSRRCAERGGDVRRSAAVAGARWGGVVLAIILSGALGRAIGRGIALPARLHDRLPRLESRLNGFVPQLLMVLRVIVVASVLLVALWIGGVASVGAWLSSPWGLAVAGTLASVLLILAVAFVLWLALTSWVEYRLNPEFGKVPTAREQTLLTLLRNAATIALAVITLMFALSELGLDIGPLLASAGVIGLAIGFGAQKLVQDVITGVFIQLENAMNVGDIVTAGTTTGVVEKLTIRSVSLRDLNGIYHLIPFSSVDSVSNFSRDYSNFVIDMGVAYREDTDEAKAAMFDAFDELKRHPEQGVNIIGEFEWFGLEQFADSAVILRARIRTLPGKQWGVGRAYNEIVKRVFDARGIEIPFPHTTLYLGENKKGQTQPIRVDRRARSSDEACVRAQSGYLW
jgi:moderate conductance mechanosensitive channel